MRSAGAPPPASDKRHLSPSFPKCLYATLPSCRPKRGLNFNGMFHSVRGTTEPLADCKKRARTSRKKLAGSRPNATVSGLSGARGRKSGPGQANVLASLTTIHERSTSSPRRRSVSGGISTAATSAPGGLWVTGTTVTISQPSSSRAANTIAQGRSFTPSSWPRRCSARHR